MANVLQPADIRAAMVAFIAETEPNARVYDRRRIVRTEQDVKRILARSTDGIVNAWMISPAQSNPVVADVKPGFVGHGVIGGGNVLTSFRFQIEGIHAIDDANSSETDFFDRAWAIVDRFNAGGSIPKVGGGKLPGLDRETPCSMDQFGFVTYAGTFLFHYCRLEVGFIGRTRPA